MGLGGWRDGIGEAVVFLSIKSSLDKLRWGTEGHQADVSGGQLVCGMPGQTSSENPIFGPVGVRMAGAHGSEGPD